MKIEFYKDWKNLTENEKKFIKVWDSIIDGLFEGKIKEKDVYSVYVGGSFSRREAKEDSDIDAYIIFKTNDSFYEFQENYFKEVINKRNDEKIIDGVKVVKHKGSIKIGGIRFGAHAYSLEELESKEQLKGENKFQQRANEKRPGSPIQFLKNLAGYKLAYGEEIDRSNVDEIYNDRVQLKDEIRSLREDALNRENPLPVKQLKYSCKKFFFIVHLEHNLRNDLNSYFHEHGREGILKLYNKRHLIHLCDKVRQNPEEYVDRREEILKKIGKYIKRLEKEFNLE